MKKILITEDDKTMAYALEVFLQDHNYETMVVNDGLRGYLRANLWHPDLILMDVFLGASTGFEVAKEVRDSSIPIIFMSANDSKSIPEMAMEFHPIAFFHKPLEVKKLLELIDNFFASPRSIKFQEVESCL